MTHLFNLGPFHNNEAVQTTVLEWLRTRRLDLYSDLIFKLVSIRDKRINIFDDNTEK